VNFEGFQAVEAPCTAASVSGMCDACLIQASLGVAFVIRMLMGEILDGRAAPGTEELQRTTSRFLEIHQERMRRSQAKRQAVQLGGEPVN